MKFVNNDPQGALDIDGVGVVEAGAEFEVTGDAAKHFESCPELFPRADKPQARRAAQSESE